MLVDPVDPVVPWSTLVDPVVPWSIPVDPVLVSVCCPRDSAEADVVLVSPSMITEDAMQPARNK